eukprot:11228303-Lingulodinium_polyedra.AAC.2
MSCARNSAVAAARQAAARPAPPCGMAARDRAAFCHCCCNHATPRWPRTPRMRRRPKAKRRTCARVCNSG